MAGTNNDGGSVASKSKEDWAIVELMGRIRLAGRVTEEDRFGSRMGRIDVPVPDKDGFVTQYFSGNSIFRVTLVSEEIARSVAGHLREIIPVSRWELPAPKPLAAPAADGGHGPDTSSWKCVECGCTNRRVCFDDEGDPCHWVAKDMCSECFEKTPEGIRKLPTEDGGSILDPENEAPAAGDIGPIEVSAEEFAILDGGRMFAPDASGFICENCRCRDDHPCFDETNSACHWVEPNKCSECYEQTPEGVIPLFPPIEIGAVALAVDEPVDWKCKVCGGPVPGFLPSTRESEPTCLDCRWRLEARLPEGSVSR